MLGLRDRPNHPGDPRPTRPTGCLCASWWAARMPLPRYRLVVEGELGPRYASAFDGMTVCPHDGQTEITGPIIDDAHLHGLLERIAGLGLRLHSVNPLETNNTHSSAPTHTQPARASHHHPGTNSRNHDPMTAVWTLLAILSMASCAYFALATLHKGHRSPLDLTQPPVPLDRRDSARTHPNARHPHHRHPTDTPHPAITPPPGRDRARADSERLCVCRSHPGQHDRSTSCGPCVGVTCDE